MPAWQEEPAHEHLDLRYLLTAPRGVTPAASTVESKDARWFTWDELTALNLDPGLRRALAKARAQARHTGTLYSSPVGEEGWGR